MKLLLVFFILLATLSYAYGDDEFVVPPFLLGETESTVLELKKLLEINADQTLYDVEQILEKWVSNKGGMIKV